MGSEISLSSRSKLLPKFFNLPRAFLGVQPYFISCDDGWTGFSESPSCYLFAGRQRETFQDAQNICQNYGAQLAKIDKESERVGGRKKNTQIPQIPKKPNQLTKVTIFFLPIRIFLPQLLVKNSMKKFGLG